MFNVSTFSDLLTGKISLGCRSRSPKWTTVRRKFLKKYPCCEVCGTTQNLNVHHIKPYHLYPELELDESNLITLCENYKKGIHCHLLVGHLGDYKKINQDCVKDAQFWNSKLKD